MNIGNGRDAIFTMYDNTVYNSCDNRKIHTRGDIYFLLAHIFLLLAVIVPASMCF